MYRWLSSSLAAVGLLSLASCSGLSRDAEDLCFVWGHRIALVKDRLYIIHGNYTFTTQSHAAPEPYLYYLDLTVNFTAETFISPTVLQSYEIPSNLVPNAAITSEDDAAILWYTNDTLYIPNSNDTDSTLMAFNTTTEDWSVVHVPKNDVDLKDRSSEISASIPSSGLSYSFGATGIPGLIKFNGSLPGSLTWDNQTSGQLPGIQVPQVSEAEMVYVPMGKAGVLLTMGGRDVSQTVSLDGSSMVSMSQISVYDIDSSRWYAVTATGNIPEGRGQFCAVVSASPDESSFQVTIFGGWDPYKGVDYENVYILAVPSFRWIKANTTDDFQIESTVSIGRAHHRCAVYKDAQMIVIGGSIRFGTAQQTKETECNSAYPPIRVLDTSVYSWKGSFDPSVKYSVPPIVTSVIGGDASGNATLTEPESGWNFSALHDIFSQRVNQVANTQTSPSPIASSTPLPSSSSSNKSSSTSHTGAIAGGTVGGIAGLVLVALACFLSWRRRRRHEPRKGTKPELSGKPVDRYDKMIHEKEGQDVSELTADNRFELGDSPVIHEVDDTISQRR